MGSILACADGLIVVPEFLGNRAPFADPHTRAVIAGLGMEDNIESLVALYIAGLCGIGYGLRQIIDAQDARGAKITSIVISGGAGRSDLVRQILADSTTVPVEAPDTEEPVLLGAAMLGALAQAPTADAFQTMQSMSKIATRYAPDTARIRDLHSRRFEQFQKLQALAREISS